MGRVWVYLSFNRSSILINLCFDWIIAKLVPLAYGIKKLQIVTVIEDEKVSVEELTEKIEAIEDLVQSVDIAAFNKI